MCDLNINSHFNQTIHKNKSFNSFIIYNRLNTKTKKKVIFTDLENIGLIGQKLQDDPSLPNGDSYTKFEYSKKKYRK